MAIIEEILRLKDEMTPGLKSVEGVAGAATKALAAVAIAAVAVGSAVAAFTSTGAEMESLRARLGTLMQDAQGANDRMKELFDFSASTPFQLDEVVAAEVTLRGFGAAAQELMPGLIDFSAAVGSDLKQSAIDFGKAWSQGATGLESDTGKILRKQIELRLGTDATKVSLERFRGAMLETLDSGMFAGGAARLSQTFSGMMSNLQDEWSRFKLEVADAGLFENVKAGLRETLTIIAENRESIGEFAEIVSSTLWSAIRVTALGIASISDHLEVWPKAISQATGVLWNFVAAHLEATRSARELVAAWLSLIDHPLADEARRAADALDAGGGNLRANAQAAFAFADSIDAGADRSEAMAAALERVEAAAKAAGEALTKGPGTAGASPTSPEAGAKAALSIEEQIAELRMKVAEREAERRELMAKKEGEWLQEQAEINAEMAAEMAAAAEARRLAAEAELVAGLQMAGSVGSSVLAGDLGGVLTTIGPELGAAMGGPAGEAAGAAAAAAINALVSLGEQGAQASLDAMQSFGDALTASVQELPKLLGGLPGMLAEVLPALGTAVAEAFPSFLEAIPELVSAMAEALPEVAFALVRALPDITIAFLKMAALLPVYFAEGLVTGLGEWWQSMGGLSGILQALADAIRQALEGIFGNEEKTGLFQSEGWFANAGRDIGAWAEQAGEDAGDFVGSHAAGGYHDRTGWAYVHAGERTIPATGAGTQTASRFARSSGGDVHLHLPAGLMIGTPEQLAREFARVLGPRSLSLGGG